MPVTVPRSLEEAIAALGRHPGAEALAGGTDLMVEVNAGRRRPAAVVALGRVPELGGWRREGDEVVLGAGLTYTGMMAPDLAGLLPALAQAARTVGSPQIRNAGTLGGNLATASPAGDTLPVLAALDATVVVAGTGGRRSVPMGSFVVGPKRTSLGPGELVVEVRVPLWSGPQEFLKVGTRNAMVISVASVALAVDRRRHRVGCALGSVGPVPIRARDAEDWVAGRVDWSTGRLEGGGVGGEGVGVGEGEPGAAASAGEACAVFGRLVAGAAVPIDDHRSTAAYRRRAVEVCAGRALGRVLAGWEPGV